LVIDAARTFGSSTIIASIDVKKNFWGKYEVFINGGSINTKIDPVVHAKKMQDLGAGEILINSIDRDGTMNGYDMKLIEMASNAVSITVIACGGDGNIKDLKDAVEIGKESAVATGSMFVFQGPHRAVLISYPSQKEFKLYLK
jgi:imidazole glycerol-phosphate synthase subunit HisF